VHERAEAVDTQATSPAELRDRDGRGLSELRQVVEVIVVVRESLLLRPYGGRLEQPAVLDRVDPEVQDVVELVSHRHPQRDAGVGVAELRRRVVVVEDEVGEALARATLSRRRIRRRVAEELLVAHVGEVDVGQTLAPAESAVRPRRRPAEGPDLNGV
jgi:hypothetical protein